MGKPILLDRCQLVGALACTDKGAVPYALGAINVRPTDVEATNGHVLVRIPHTGLDAGDFPQVAGAPIEAPDGPFLMPGELAAMILKALPRKSTMSILTYAKVGVQDGEVLAAVTDLETTSTPRAKSPGETFPRTDKVIPEHSKPLFALAVCMLERLCKVAKAGDSRSPNLMFYQPKDADSPIRVEIPLGDDRMALAVIMPCRAEWPEEKADEVTPESTTPSS